MIVSCSCPRLRDIQERHGYLPEKELELTALRLDVPLCQVQEVASFFPHFRLKPPATVCVGVCQSMSCHLRGGRDAGKGQASLQTGDRRRSS